MRCFSMYSNIPPNKQIEFLERQYNTLMNIQIDSNAQEKAKIFKSDTILLMDKFFGSNNSFSRDIDKLSFDPYEYNRRAGTNDFRKTFRAELLRKYVVSAANTLERAISNIKLKQELLEEDQVVLEPTNTEKTKDTTKVFIVHGHDDALKDKVARFIENLNLKAIILHEQSDRGQTIISKFEANSDVGFAIVLYTPCDVGRPIKLNAEGKEYPERNRARQNVIFEHGFFAAKLGLENVVALKKGDVEIPNDLSGVVYKEYDEGGSWKYQIARELDESGYEIDYKLIR